MDTVTIALVLSLISSIGLVTAGIVAMSRRLIVSDCCCCHTLFTQRHPKTEHWPQVMYKKLKKINKIKIKIF